MKSKARSVDEYLESLPADRRDAVTRLRDVCRKTLTGYEESMGWGMPCYGKKGEAPEIAFASQKNYISLYVFKTSVVKKNLALLKGLGIGKSCINYAKPEKLDFKVIRKLLNESLRAPVR
jgi:hypothetical protein